MATVPMVWAAVRRRRNGLVLRSGARGGGPRGRDWGFGSHRLGRREVGT